MPQAHIRVVAAPVGGGFGGKLDPFAHEIAACKLSQLTGRPVKIALTREEVFYVHRGRHPVLMWIKTGFTKDGAITGMHFRSWLDGGAYGSYGVASTFYTGALQTVTYKIPVYKFEGARIFTNKPPCGPKRGHGTPQPRFAMECQIDKAAEQLGLDPADMRRRNLAEPFTKTANHLTVTTIGLGECIDRVVEASGWREKRGKLPPGRGMGIACSSYLTGAGTAIYWNDMPHSGVVVRADRSGLVAILCGATDIGQGSDSVLAYLVAEVLGIQPMDVRVHPADTDLTPVDLGSYSSRVTLMAGNAAIQATMRLRDRIFEAAARKLEVTPDRLAARDRRVFVADEPDKGMTFAEAVVLGESMHGVLAFPGSYAPPKRAGKYKGGGVGPSPCYSYSACVVEVAVDAETGEVKPTEIWIAHDIGRALNPLLVEGQVEGSIYMGLGEVLMEEQVFRKGVHKAPSMLEYKSPTTLETPEIHTILVETDDPEGPFGAKEAGQGPLLPVIPAVANAVHDAVGVRIDETPISPEKVLKALELGRQGKSPARGAGQAPALQVPGAEGGGVGVRAARREHHGKALRYMMRLPEFSYLAPVSVGDAVKLMADHGPAAMFVAGGTDLYPNMKRRQFEPSVLVGLRGIREHVRRPRLAEDGPHHRRGHVAHRGVLASGGGRPLCRPRHGGGPRVDARSSGTWARSAAMSAWTRAATTTTSPTSGGRPCDFCMKKDGDICLVAPGSSRCWAVSSSDTAPVLWSLGAQVRLAGPGGERRIPVSALYQDDGIQYLSKQPGEVVTEIVLPPVDGWRSVYLKLRRRGSFDFPVLGRGRRPPDGGRHRAGGARSPWAPWPPCRARRPRPPRSWPASGSPRS